MRRVRLGTLLIGLNTGLVLLAVLCVSVVSVRLLRRLGAEQAHARVGLAGVHALQAVERSTRDVTTSADLLGERPTVGRLLREGDSRGLTAFLDRFRRTSRLSTCAVLSGGRLVAVSGSPLPWRELARVAAGDGEAIVTDSGGRLVLGTVSPVVSFPGATAVSALVVEARVVREIGRQVGLPVAIVPRARGEAWEDSPRSTLRGRVLETGRMATAELEAGYLAIHPLKDPAGKVVALVETSLPSASAASSLSRLVHLLLWTSLIVAALASLSGLLISRRLTGPMKALTSAAERIGRGDLATPVSRAPGEELGALATTLEESRRQLLRLTSELRRRQAEGESILTGISEGVFSVDRDRKIRYLNPQAARLLGVAPEAAIGRFCGDVLKPMASGGVRPCDDHCPILHARFRGATRATERLQLADGGQKVVVITSAPPAEDLQFQVFSDETEQDAARRLRDAVLAHISHEFRTPLAAQRASLELLRERLDEIDRDARESGGGADDATRRLVLSLERGSLRLTQLVDNLLESVRIEAGHTSLRRSAVALDEVVEEAVEMTSPLLAQRNQRLELDLPYPLPEVEGDAPRLIQVFVNLLANAQKFAPADSLVRIGGEVRPEVVILWVEDEGPGIPGGAGRSLFERFVRAPGREDEPEQSGMGLGLWIVQSIVERHGGTVEARREGAGTRVRVTLPRRPAAGRIAERATA